METSELVVRLPPLSGQRFNPLPFRQGGLLCLQELNDEHDVLQKDGNEIEPNFTRNPQSSKPDRTYTEEVILLRPQSVLQQEPFEFLQPSEEITVAQGHLDGSWPWSKLGPTTRGKSLETGDNALCPIHTAPSPDNKSRRSGVGSDLVTG